MKLNFSCDNQSYNLKKFSYVSYTEKLSLEKNYLDFF